jgi:hypothetical protein
LSIWSDHIDKTGRLPEEAEEQRMRWRVVAVLWSGRVDLAQMKARLRAKMEARIAMLTEAAGETIVVKADPVAEVEAALQVYERVQLEVDGQLESMLETTAQDTETEVATADAEAELKVATTIEAEVVAAEAEAATKVAAADAEMKAAAELAAAAEAVAVDAEAAAELAAADGKMKAAAEVAAAVDAMAATWPVLLRLFALLASAAATSAFCAAAALSEKPYTSCPAFCHAAIRYVLTSLPWASPCGRAPATILATCSISSALMPSSPRTPSRPSPCALWRLLL